MFSLEPRWNWLEITLNFNIEGNSIIDMTCSICKISTEILASHYNRNTCTILLLSFGSIKSLITVIYFFNIPWELNTNRRNIFVLFHLKWKYVFVLTCFFFKSKLQSKNGLKYVNEICIWKYRGNYVYEYFLKCISFLELHCTRLFELFS